MKKYLSFSSDTFYRALGRMSVTTAISSVLGLMFAALVNGDVATRASGYDGFVGVFLWVTVPAAAFYLLINSFLLMRRLDRSRLEEPSERWAFLCREFTAATVCGAMLALPVAILFAILGVEGIMTRFMAAAFIFAPQCAGYFILDGNPAAFLFTIVLYPATASAILYKRVYNPRHPKR